MLINFAIIENWSNGRYEMIMPESGVSCMLYACSFQVSAESLTQRRLSEVASLGTSKQLVRLRYRNDGNDDIRLWVQKPIRILTSV